MPRNNIFCELPDVPLAQPGFDAMNLAAPVLLHSNPQGKWQTKVPDSMDAEVLKAIVEHLAASKIITSEGTYCRQCALENKNYACRSNYVPVIMMPLYLMDQCPLEMISECTENKDPKSKSKKEVADEETINKQKAKTSK